MCLQLQPRDLNRKSSIDRALIHFDDFYKSVYGKKWPGIRASLLTENKYAALVNNFGDTESTKQSIELNGAVNIRKVFEIYYNEADSMEEDTNELNKQSTKPTPVEKRLEQVMKEKQTGEIRSIYQKHAEEELEKIEYEKRMEPSRTIESKHVVDYKKSLQQSLEEDTEYDFDRMISSEIGVLGLQEFIPATKLKGMEDFVPESDHYRYYETNVNFPLKFEVEKSFKFPKTLDLYTYPKGDISRFSRPKRCSTDLFSHFLCDGASILPPLMLNVEYDDVVLDACAAPGGKSLVLLQSFLLKQIVCNDESYFRCNRIRSLFKQFLPNFETSLDGEKVIISNSDVRHLNEFSKYDKVCIQLTFMLIVFVL